MHSFAGVYKMVYYGDPGHGWEWSAANGNREPAADEWVFLGCVMNTPADYAGAIGYQRYPDQSSLVTGTFSTYWSVGSSDDKLFIGDSVFDHTDYTTGDVASVKVWARALSAEEMLIESMLLNRVAFPDSLKLFLPLFENYADYSGNNNVASNVHYITNPPAAVANSPPVSWGGRVIIPLKGGVSYRYAYPISDQSSGSWAPSAGGSLYGTIDETVADDSDYDFVTARSNAFRVKIGDPTPVGSGTVNLQVRIPTGFSPRGTLIVKLYEGGTQRASWTINPVVAGNLEVLNLSSGEKASITDWTNLYVDISTSA
jgi:hypothetical protein